MGLKPSFPFLYFITGVQSLSIGADAINFGGIDAFEKGTDSLDYILGEVCRTAALGYVLGGRTTKALDTFKLLNDEKIATPEQWAERNKTSLRHLHRICSVQSPKSPQCCIALFRALSYVMRPSGDAAAARPGIDGWCPDPKLRQHYMDCMEYVLEKAECKGALRARLID